NGFAAFWIITTKCNRHIYPPFLCRIITAFILLSLRVKKRLWREMSFWGREMQLARLKKA
ncbi:MAG: hypothetical protein MR888_06365, partial [Clostridiales bacterium]|nr:hypothetical protein [Clostridiales bacterium]